MSMIEGIGDEVTILLAIILIVAVIAIAWMSTRVDTLPYTSIVIIDRDRFVELLRRLRGISSSSSVINSSASSGDVAANAARDETAAESTTNLNTASTSDGGVVADEPAAATVQSDDETRGSTLNTEDPSAVNQQQLPSDTPDAASLSSQPADTSPELITSGSDRRDSISPQSSADQPTPSSSDSSADKVQIRLQYVDGRQRTVLASPDDTIGQLKRSYFADELAANSVVRFIASGKELGDETSTLRSLQLGRTGAVIHCLVTPRRTSPSNSSNPTDSATATVVGHQFDVGFLVFPLFGSVLAALWYARVVYRGYFNGTSTFSLFAVSFLYLIALFASLRGGGGQQEQQHAHSD